MIYFVTIKWRFFWKLFDYLGVNPKLLTIPRWRILKCVFIYRKFAKILFYWTEEDAFGPRSAGGLCAAPCLSFGLFCLPGDPPVAAVICAYEEIPLGWIPNFVLSFSHSKLRSHPGPVCRPPPFPLPPPYHSCPTFCLQPITGIKLRRSMVCTSLHTTKIRAENVQIFRENILWK